MIHGQPNHVEELMRKSIDVSFENLQDGHQLDIQFAEKFCHIFKERFLKLDSAGLSYDIISPLQILHAVASENNTALKTLPNKRPVSLHFLPKHGHYVVSQSSDDGKWIHVYDSQSEEMELREMMTEVEEQLVKI